MLWAEYCPAMRLQRHYIVQGDRIVQHITLAQVL